MARGPFEVKFATDQVPPLAPFYILPDSSLNISVLNSLTSLSLVLSGRILLPDGSQSFFQELLTPSTDRVESNAFFRLPEGFLLNMNVYDSGAVARRGNAWVRLALVRGRQVTTNLYAILAQDYLVRVGNIAWPGGFLRHPTEGPGLIRSVTGTDPAAGAEISETVPTNARWILHSFIANLVTDATAGNRRVRLEIDDG